MFRLIEVTWSRPSACWTVSITEELPLDQWIVRGTKTAYPKKLLLLYYNTQHYTKNIYPVMLVGHMDFNSGASMTRAGPANIKQSIIYHFDWQNLGLGNGNVKMFNADHNKAVFFATGVWESALIITQIKFLPSIYIQFLNRLSIMSVAIKWQYFH